MFDSSINGINSAFTQFEQSADKIARAAQDKDVNLAREITDSLISKNAAQANTKVIQVQDEVLGSLLDMVG